MQPKVTIINFSKKHKISFNDCRLPSHKELSVLFFVLQWAYSDIVVITYDCIEFYYIKKRYVDMREHYKRECECYICSLYNNERGVYKYEEFTLTDNCLEKV